MNEHFEVLAKWVGRIAEVGSETFRAVITDQLEQRPDEEVEIYRKEVAPADASLVREGAIFYWHIGYVDSRGGGRARQSVIRFQRRPGLTEDDLQAARRWAERMGRLVSRE